MRQPVSTIMITNLFTVAPTDKLTAVKDIFDKHMIHHIPVVHYKELSGIVSYTDYLKVLKSKFDESGQTLAEILDAHTVEEIMTTRIARLEPNDQIGTAAELMLTNMFHAVPVCENGELVGLVTTHDVIKHALSEAYPDKHTIFG
jgi:CBS domain-containing protein